MTSYMLPTINLRKYESVYVQKWYLFNSPIRIRAVTLFVLTGTVSNNYFAGEHSNSYAPEIFRSYFFMSFMLAKVTELGHS
jgi:hypothetical protein